MTLLSWIRTVADDRFPMLMAAFRAVKEVFNASRSMSMSPLGFKFVGLRDMEEGTFESDEVAIVQRLLPHVDVVINIGANSGYYCCIAASAGKRAIAFEPFFPNTQLLLRNIKENGWSDLVEVYPMGLADAVGIAELFGGGPAASLTKGWAGASPARVRLAAISTADAVLGERLNGQKALVIIDIEGAEFRALKGSSLLLAQSPRPIWMIEIVVDENRPKDASVNPNLRDTFLLFWQLGYESWTADARRIRVEPEDVDRALRAETNTMGAHNSLFLDPADRELLFARD